jgi:hypothetical protein
MAAPSAPGRFLVLISVRDEVEPWVILRLEKSGFVFLFLLIILRVSQ